MADEPGPSNPRKTDEKKKPDPVSCDYCGKKCSKNSNLSTHIDTKHKGLRFICPVSPCSFVTTTKNFLRIHIMDKHQEYDSTIPAGQFFWVDFNGEPMDAARKNNLLVQLTKEVEKAEKTEANLQQELEKLMNNVTWTEEEDRIILENIKKNNTDFRTIRLPNKSMYAVERRLEHFLEICRKSQIRAKTNQLNE